MMGNGNANSSELGSKEKVTLSRKEFEDLQKVKLLTEVKTDLLSWGKILITIAVVGGSSVSAVGLLAYLDWRVRDRIDTMTREPIYEARYATNNVKKEIKKTEEALIELNTQRATLQTEFARLTQKQQSLTAEVALFKATVNGMERDQKSLKKSVIKKDACLNSKQETSKDFEKNSQSIILIFFRDQHATEAENLERYLLNAGFRSSSTPSDLTENRTIRPVNAISILTRGENGDLAKDLVKRIKEQFSDREVFPVSNPNMKRGDAQILFW